MVGHIKELGAEFAKLCGVNRTSPAEIEALLEVWNAFAEEVKALDQADFAPDVRAEFLKARAAPDRRMATRNYSDTAPLRPVVDRLIRVLDNYGPLAQPPSRVFTWLNDADLRRIIERDYIELSSLLLPSGAWKSTVIMAGSITEAILFDLLTKDAPRLVKAQASSKVPTKTPQGGQPTKLPSKKWTLADLIAIATDIDLIPVDRANTFDQVLRDYRNFVHPAKELRAAHPCDEGEAYLARGALVALCDHFDRMFP